MKYLKPFLEEVKSYSYELISDDPKLVKYGFVDIESNNYLVEFKNISNSKSLGTTYELVYFVEDETGYSVSKIVNVNIYSVLQTIFKDILTDFISRFSWAKSIFFIGLAKDREKNFITLRTKIYMRYLTRNPVSGFRVSQVGNTIRLNRI